MSFIKVQGKYINIKPSVYILESLVNIYIKVSFICVCYYNTGIIR
jgi:hypothetical protein